MPELIPQAAPGRAYALRQREIDNAIQRVMEGGRYVLGPEVASFEAEFAAYLGVGHAVGVANGTDALELALRAVGVGPGDGVYTVSQTAVATISAIEATGATPVLIDVEPTTFLMDVGQLRDAVRTGTGTHGLRRAAIVPVHLYGQMADMPAILDIGRSAGMRIVEDCAQAHGARLDEQLAGSWGDAAAFSFYPTKNLGAFGDAGLVATTDLEIADRLRRLREYGWTEARISTDPGGNSRLDELQAAILRVGLSYLDGDNTRRGVVASRYDAAGSGSLIMPTVLAGRHHVYHQYVVRTKRRDEFRAHLAKRGVGTAVHYPLPVHQQPAYARLGGTMSLRATETLAKEIVSLPIYPFLQESEVERVCDGLSSWTG